MTQHCDRCGTELDSSQARHQRYSMEHAAPDVETLQGRLCSDCFFAFEEWLETR